MGGTFENARSNQSKNINQSQVDSHSLADGQIVCHEYSFSLVGEKFSLIVPMNGRPSGFGKRFIRDH